MAFNPRQYQVPSPFFGGADPNVVHEMDKARIQAYDLYEDIYNNNHNSLKLVLRGDDALPIYMPSGKKIVNTTNRFLAKNLNYYVEPTNILGEPTDEGTLKIVEQYMKTFYTREEVRKKFSRSKRWGLVRADAVFLITADENKNAGERISLHEVDPRQVFVIDDPDDANRIWGYYLIEQVRDPRETDKNSTKQVTKRTVYKREKDDNGTYTGKILYGVSHFTQGKWDDRVLEADDIEQVTHADLADVDEAPLDDQITALPIYRWGTDVPQGSSWGTSLLSGLETLIFGINQSLSDEDLTLVMRGLGMYVTNAAPPINADTGEILAWNVGPGQVIEVSSDQEFTNVAGVSDVSPYQDHMKYMDEVGLQESSGTPAVAVGRVDVAVAESGISLKLQLDPLLAANEDRELEIVTVLDQLHHDLVKMWLPAYEGIQTNGCVVSTIFDDPMPVNRDAEIQETVLLRQSNYILTSMVVDKLSSLGWKYPPDMTVDDIVAALQEQAAGDATAADPFAASGGLDGGAGGFDENVDPETGEPIPDTATVSLGVT